MEPRLRRRLVERLVLHPGDTVLDLTCGTGLNFAAITEGQRGPDQRVEDLGLGRHGAAFGDDLSLA